MYYNWLTMARYALLYSMLNANFMLPVAYAVPKLLAPTTGIYSGAYMDFGDDEDTVTLDAIENFTALVGKRQAIIGFGNNWGKNKFPTDQVRIIHNSGAIPLILWYPREISNEIPKTIFNLESINAGKWDDYLDAWGQAAKLIKAPILVSWGLEMNGSWYSWSGVYHGNSKIIPNTDPPKYQGPETYKQAYKHVVDKIRANGANNIEWVFHTNNTSFPKERWNSMAMYYPGSEYADWIGMSAYGMQTLQASWRNVTDVLLKPYAELAAIDPSKPLLIAEWGVGEFPKHGNKAAWITQAMREMQNLPRLKGAVVWHERWQNADLSYSNLRINSSLKTLNAYRMAIENPFWLERPLLSAPISK
jgi:hypothetical protein